MEEKCEREGAEERRPTWRKISTGSGGGRQGRKTCRDSMLEGRASQGELKKKSLRVAKPDRGAVIASFLAGKKRGENEGTFRAMGNRTQKIRGTLQPDCTWEKARSRPMQTSS